MYRARFKIPWELIKTVSKNDLDPMSKLSYVLSSGLDLKENEMIDVSKIIVNNVTYFKLEEYVMKYLTKKTGSKTLGKKALVWYTLDVAPSQDLSNTLNLEDDYIYVKEDFIKIREV